MKGAGGTLKSVLLLPSLLLLPLVADRAEAVGERAGVEAAHVAALLLRARLLVHLGGVFGNNGYRFRGRLTMGCSPREDRRINEC